MNELTKLYISVFEPVLSEMGFKRKGKMFHRLVNEKIVQLFSIQKFKYDFTLEYSIYPVCSGNEIVSPFDGSRIGKFLGGEALCYWDIDDNIKKHFDEGLSVCQKYLFPCFKYVCDYETYYDYCFEMHKAISKKMNLQGVLSKYPLNSGLYEVCLCLGKYDMALNLKENYLRYLMDSQKEHIERYGKIKPLLIEWIEEVESQINETQQFKNKIKNQDDMIFSLEQQALKSYCRKFCIR